MKVVSETLKLVTGRNAKPSILACEPNAAMAKRPNELICERTITLARDYIDREINSSLSGGELKRIEIATVLAKASKLSIFDEPEAGIDLWSFSNLIDVFRRMRSEIKGGTIIIISHQERILGIADEIILIKNGTLAGRGTKDEMLPQLAVTNDVTRECRKGAAGVEDEEC